MKKHLLLLAVVCISITFAQNKILFFQTDWGMSLNDDFCKRAKLDGYDGIETWYPHGNEKKLNEIKALLDKYNLKVIFLHGTNKSLPFKESLKSFKKGLIEIAKLKPTLINCHTGDEFWTFEQNKAFMEAGIKVTKKTGIKVSHETHRGRALYSLVEALKFVDNIPDIQLNADFSHWMVVHESLLEDKSDEWDKIISKTIHIHSRVGQYNSPQVSDPTAPEWKHAVDVHMKLWEKIIRKSWKENNGIATITTEFGPSGYMPTLPYTNLPVADQWKANVDIMKMIKKYMKVD